MLPAGVTRFVVEARVLNVRYPLGLLEKGEPAARNAELREFVRRTWQGGRVRYYALRRARDPLRVGSPDERGARAEPLLPRGA